MEVFPAADSDDMAVVICPGGGYRMLAKQHEGYDWVDLFNKEGITVGVLTYRMPRGRHNVPADDARAAVEALRASGYSRIGIMGSSAGGHLASTVATHADGAARPDFQILFYPVISMDTTITHRGSHDNLIGKDAAPGMETLYSNELQVRSTDGPALIFHCTDDNTVPVANAVRYYSALHDAGVDATMYIYPTGRHGWGKNEDFEYRDDVDRALVHWIRHMKKITEKSADASTK